MRLAANIVVLGAVLVGGCGDGTITVELTRADLQKRLDAKFPVEMERLKTRVVLSDPKVLLEPGRDDIGVDLKVTVDPPVFGPHSGRIAARGTLSYARDDKAFYLQNPRVEKLEIEELSPASVDKVRAPIEAVAAGAFEIFPVFELAQRNLEELTAEHVLRKVSVRDGKVLAVLGLPQ